MHRKLQEACKKNFHHISSTSKSVVPSYDQNKSLSIVFFLFLTLEFKSNKPGPQIRILHEMSFLEPAPKVWNPNSRFTKDKLCF